MTSAATSGSSGDFAGSGAADYLRGTKRPLKAVNSDLCDLIQRVQSDSKKVK